MVAAVVLAAGRGTRLRPLTDLRPKPLCPVDNVALLDRNLTAARAVADAVAVNAFHLAEQVVAHVGGRALGTPQYDEKLAFLDAMRARLAALAERPEPVFVAGDFNVAPEDRDVWDPSLFVGTTHTSVPERERLGALLATGLVDAFRVAQPDATGYTYWDYRAGMFHRNLGMRIDLALLSAPLAPRVRRCGIDRDFRKGLKPSDHAPLLVELG